MPFQIWLINSTLVAVLLKLLQICYITKHNNLYQLDYRLTTLRIIIYQTSTRNILVYHFTIIYLHNLSFYYISVVPLVD